MIDKSIRQYQNRVGLRYGTSPGRAQAEGTGASSHGQSAASPSRDGGGGPPNRNFVSQPPPTQVRVEPPEPKLSPIQSMAMVGDISLAGKTQKEAEASVDRDNQPISGGESMARFGTPVYAGTTKKVADEMISRGEGQMDAREDYISRQYNQPVTKKKTNLQKATGIELIDTGPKIDIKDTVQRGLFNTLVAKPVAQKVGLGAAFGPLGILAGMLFSKLTGKKAPNAYDVTTNLFSNQNTGSKTGTINNISNVQDTRDGIRSNIVAGGGDVVSQKVKEFTGEPTVEKVTEQPSDSQRSQLLKLLQQLQQYNSQNRLNEKGKQTLAQLMSFMNQPITGRSRDI